MPPTKILESKFWHGTPEFMVRMKRILFFPSTKYVVFIIKVYKWIRTKELINFLCDSKLALFVQSLSPSSTYILPSYLKLTGTSQNNCHETKLYLSDSWKWLKWESSTLFKQIPFHNLKSQYNIHVIIKLKRMVAAEPVHARRHVGVLPLPAFFLTLSWRGLCVIPTSIQALFRHFSSPN